MLRDLLRATAEVDADELFDVYFTALEIRWGECGEAVIDPPSVKRQDVEDLGFAIRAIRRVPIDFPPG